MARFPASRTRQGSEATQWDNLKQAIASSSGFQSWRLEQLSLNTQLQESLDHQVCRYLRETLETLAY
ncbi:hypothetical protein [Chroococcidiopsis sp. CCMEE 29]|uniref:hypothetical protein n=1 Tax=Chroococcidiopsis sp. CCMEE 29 TaxID=155894 RepID=UPI00201FD8CD|nr:hypothetical protein [Chroococcidiopsis sp. CCMEE 29]